MFTILGKTNSPKKKESNTKIAKSKKSKNIKMHTAP